MRSQPDRLARRELTVCIACNRLNRYVPLSRLLGTASHLGNGLFWYVLMAGLLLVHGLAAVGPVVTMGATGVAGTLVYKLLKRGTMRSRPCSVLDEHELVRTVEPLDLFSFPSGHTLHAVAFTIIAVSAWPWLAWSLVPFTVLVALSRLVLGLHYPSDVLAGAGIGTGLAALALAITDGGRLLSPI